jgi:hypothetical protein
MGAQIDDERSHPAIVSDLLDLQARLRGEPASLVRSGMSRPAEAAAVDVLDRPAVTSEHTVSRIEALRRRLAFLELEIEAYETAVTALRSRHPRPGIVLPFRRPSGDPQPR